MVAYSFQRGFVGPIDAGTKVHTMRNPRKRHARPGEELQLYYGMRTRSCRLIARATCTQVIGVTLRLSYGEIWLYEIAELLPGEPRRVSALHPVTDRDAIAVADGFRNFYAMARWWRTTHGRAMWSGVLIGWGAPYLAGMNPVGAAIAIDERRDSPPAPWSQDPWSWGPPAIAERVARGAWRVDGALRRYRSTVDPRVTATAPVGSGNGFATYGCTAEGVDGAEHASLEEIAVILLRIDRAAAADREWQSPSAPPPVDCSATRGSERPPRSE